MKGKKGKKGSRDGKVKEDARARGRERHVQEAKWLTLAKSLESPPPSLADMVVVVVDDSGIRSAGLQGVPTDSMVRHATLR